MSFYDLNICLIDKDDTHPRGGSSLWQPERYSVLSPPFNVNSEPLGSLNLPPLGTGILSEQGHFGDRMPSDSDGFNHDISQMSKNSPKNSEHQRVHSEILTFPNDLSFDSDLGVVGRFDGPLFSYEIQEELQSMY